MGSTHARPVSRRAGLHAIAAAAVLIAAPVHAQQEAARLLGTAFDSTAMRPLAGAVVTLAPGRRSVRADDQGRFFLPGLPPGDYRVEVRHPRLDTLGIAQLASPPLEFLAGATTPVELAVPSWSSLLTRLCDDEPGRAALAGFVQDPAGVRLPEASIALWSDARGDTVRTRADAYGRYVACGLPAASGWHARARYDDAAGDAVALAFQGTGAATHDLVVTVTEPGTVLGTLVDGATGEPVEGAVATLTPGGPAVVSNGAGRLLLPSVAPGVHTLELTHIAYGTTSMVVEVVAGRTVTFEARLAPQAIELEDIRVVARGARELDAQMRGTPARVLTRQDIEALPAPPRNIGDLLRNMPGLEVYGGQIGGTVCIMGTQRIRSRPVQMPDGTSKRKSGGCEPPLVMIDGALVGERLSGNAGDYFAGRNWDTIGELLASFPVDDIERVEYLKPTEAGIRFGTLAGQGVLIIETRRGRRREP